MSNLERELKYPIPTRISIAHPLDHAVNKDSHPTTLIGLPKTSLSFGKRLVVVFSPLYSSGRRVSSPVIGETTVLATSNNGFHC
jgi:hypothetical protein